MPSARTHRSRHVGLYMVINASIVAKGTPLAVPCVWKEMWRRRQGQSLQGSMQVITEARGKLVAKEAEQGVQGR